MSTQIQKIKASTKEVESRHREMPFEHLNPESDV